MKKLNIWLIQRAEQTILDGSDVKLMRTGILSQLLSKNNHNVKIWTSDFNHMRHQLRYKRNHLVKINKNLSIQFIKSIGYSRNLSIRRLIDEKYISRNFKNLIKNSVPPDLILISIPSIEIGYEAYKFAKKNNIPIITDIRDLWPDVFYEVLPPFFAPLIFPLYSYYNLKLTKILSHSKSIVGLTESYLKWSLSKIVRSRIKEDKVFKMGYRRNINLEVDQSLNLYSKIQKLRAKKRLIITFIGTLGKTNNLEPILKAAADKKFLEYGFALIIAGSGEKLEHYRKKYSKYENIIFTGWIDHNSITLILKSSDIGILPYIESKNYKLNIPNKPAEYMSEGLILALSNNEGDLYDLIQDNNLGFTYNHDSQSFLNEIINLSKNTDKIKELKKNSHYVYEKNFNADNLYEKYVRHIEEISGYETQNK